MNKRMKTPIEKRKEATVSIFCWLVAFLVSSEVMNLMTAFLNVSFESNPMYIPGLLCVFLSFIMVFVNLREYWKLRGINDYDDWLELEMGELEVIS